MPFDQFKQIYALLSTIYDQDICCRFGEYIDQASGVIRSTGNGAIDLLTCPPGVKNVN
jgi:hypothetical protein